MDKVVPFVIHERHLPEDDEKGLRFLEEEGFDLLAAFRCIEDREVRRSIMTMVETIARSFTKTP